MFFIRPHANKNVFAASKHLFGSEVSISGERPTTTARGRINVRHGRRQKRETEFVDAAWYRISKNETGVNEFET